MSLRPRGHQVRTSLGRLARSVEGNLASLAGETDTLRRQRLFAAAVSLAVVFGLLCVWVFASDNPGTLTVEGSRYSFRVGLIGLRCLLAVVVAGCWPAKRHSLTSSFASSSTCCFWDSRCS